MMKGSIIMYESLQQFIFEDGAIKGCFKRKPIAHSEGYLSRQDAINEIDNLCKKHPAPDGWKAIGYVDLVHDRWFAFVDHALYL